MRLSSLILLVCMGIVGGALGMRFIDESKPSLAQAQSIQPPVSGQAAPDTLQALPQEQQSQAPAMEAPTRREAPKPQRFRQEEGPGQKGTAPAGPVESHTTGPVPGTPSQRVVPPGGAAETPAPRPREVTLSAGMTLPVRLVSSLSPAQDVRGEGFEATLDREIDIDGLVIAERGARVEGLVLAGGRGLSLELTRLYTSDGQKVEIHTGEFDRVGTDPLPAQAALTFRLKTPVTLTERRLVY